MDFDNNKLILEDFDDLDRFTLEFDKILIDLWQKAQSRKAFAFDFDRNNVRYRKLSGKWNLQLQMNAKRNETKRKGQKMSALKAICNPNDFNFTQVSEKEKLFEFELRMTESATRRQQRCTALVIINRSPFEFGSSLILPNCEAIESQLLRPNSMLLGLLFALLSLEANCLVGFNSIGANASVNHCHWHLAYLAEQTPLSYLPLSPTVDPSTQSVVTIDWIVQTIVLYIPNRSIQSWSDLWRLTERLCAWLDYLVNELSLAYNIVIVKQQSQSQQPSTESSAWRICVWIRSPVLEEKTLNEIKPAICEFGGLFCCKSEQEFDLWTEKDCVDHMQRLETDCFTFNQAKQKLISLFV